MMITQKELDVLQFQGNLFYVAFEAKNKNEPTTFYFELKVLEMNKILNLEENEENSGLIVQ